MTYHLWKKYSPLLLYVGVMLLAISDTGVQMLILNTVGFQSRLLRKIAISLIFVKILGTRYTKKEFFILFPIAALSLYNYTICANNYCIWNILMIAALKDIHYKQLFKVLFYSSFFAMLFVGLLSFAGIGGPLFLSEAFGRGKIETRYCFGMYHPNIWHFAFARCVIFFVVAYHESLKWKSIVLLLLLNAAAYYFSASRTGFLATTLFLLFMLLYKYCSKLMNSKPVQFLLSSGTACLFGLYGYYLILYQKSEDLTALWISQKLTTGRLTQAADYLAQYPIRLWGTRFPDDGTVMDCGFFRMLSEYGWILSVIFILGYILLFYLAMKYHHYEITATCIFLALYSLYETYPTTRPSYNIAIFFIPFLIFNSKHLFSKKQSVYDNKSSSFD